MAAAAIVLLAIGLPFLLPDREFSHPVEFLFSDAQQRGTAQAITAAYDFDPKTHQINLERARCAGFTSLKVSFSNGKVSGYEIDLRNDRCDLAEKDLSSLLAKKFGQEPKATKVGNRDTQIFAEDPIVGLAKSHTGWTIAVIEKPV